MKANKIHPTKLDSSPRDHDPENNDLFSPIMDSIQPQKSKISQKNLSTPSGLDNFKKFFNDFTKEAVSINYRETVRNEKEESQSSDPQHKWMLTLRILKDLLALNFQILLFFLNILSVINFILISEYRLGQMDITSEDSLIKVEWVIAANFSLEIILSVVLARGSLFKKIRKLLAVHNIINYLLIIEIIDTTVYSSRFVRRGIFYMLVTVFRSAKLNKVRETGSSILKEINFLFKKEKEYHIDSAKDQSDVKYFVYSSSLEIVIGIFQEATLCMAINEALDYQGYGNSNGVIVFDYKAAYYSVIVSMTSIGYGDIFPKLWPTRLCTICLLFVDISVLSNYIGQMTEYMYRLSPFIRNIKFENHIVIIGDMPLTFLKYFIKELNQVDFLTTKVYNSAEKEKKKLTASKMIVIGSENPAKELETWLEDFSESHVEIKYLKSNSLETLWFKQANLNSARHLFAFSMQQNETEDQCFESDKKMSYNVLEVVNRFPNLEITLVLSTDFTNQIKKDSLWTKVNVMSAQIINEYVMANSIENQGINVWLTHLSTLREKSLTASNGTVLQELEDYSSNMNQEIYPIKLPSFFVGKTFQQAIKLTYFSSFDISETYSFDYSSNNFPKEKSLPHRSGLLLFGIQFNDILLPQTSSILINPSNYTIKKDDIGFVVAYDIKNAKEISNYTENDSQHNCYNKNMEFFKKANSDEKAPKALEVMAMKLDSQLKDWRIKKEKFLNRAIKTSIDNQMIEIPTIYNLYEENGPKGIFENHVIVRGTIARFRHIAMVIRSYSERPIILFSEDKANLSEWVKFQDVFRNIYYVYGSPTKIKHIIQLDPKKAFKILILSSSNNNFFMDSESIVFTRIISDFFGLKNFLTEITEETNMRYISVNPRHQNNNYLLWPYFVRGSIHFSSLAMSIIAKSLNNKNWVSLIKNITKPPSNYKKDKEFNQNSTLNTLTLTAEGKKEFQFFGHLQYILMSNNPSVIAIAILKTGNTENNQQRATLLKNVSMSGSPTMREKKITSTLTKMMENFYGSEFLMTNPSALMPLREGDKILVIGNIKNDNENYFKKTINSSFRIDTQAGGADKRTEKPLHKNSAENLYNYMAAPDYESKNIAGIKEKIGDTVREFNELLGLLLKNN